MKMSMWTELEELQDQIEQMGLPVFLSTQVDEK
jgi:hypothetical protein